MADPSEPDGWDPDQYHRFAAERSQPFFDLLALLDPVPGGAVVDLGCGSGELTKALHEHAGAGQTTGVDASPAMLERAAAHAGPALTFAAGDLRERPPDAPFDVVFSNAALQWVPDHDAVLTTWCSWLRPGGQLAVQVPANADHPSHTVSAALAEEEPYRSAFASGPPSDPVHSVLAPAAYAELLHRLGFAQQHVRLQVYGHVLDSSADVVEWVRGTSLTRFQGSLPPALFDRFLADYRARVLTELGQRAPYFYAFKRILLWGRLPR